MVLRRVHRAQPCVAQRPSHPLTAHDQNRRARVKILGEQTGRRHGRGNHLAGRRRDAHPPQLAGHDLGGPGGVVGDEGNRDAALPDPGQRRRGTIDRLVPDVEHPVEVEQQEVMAVHERPVAPRQGSPHPHHHAPLSPYDHRVPDDTPHDTPHDRPHDTVPRPDGLVLAPFRGLRPDPTVVAVAAVLAPPYDVIDDAERDALIARDPHNVVRLTLPQGDYEGAALTLADWRREGAFVPDPTPGVYVYEQQADGHVQRGLVGALGLTPAEDRIVLPHENTMPGPVADRLALMVATEADLEMIFLVYDGGGAASRLVAAADSRPPLADVVDMTGVRHRLWAVTEPDDLAELAADLHGRRAVIADGHHRYATFCAYQAQRHAAGDGDGPWDLGLAFLVDGSTFGPQVHAIHRALPGLDPTSALDRAAVGFSVTPLDGLESATGALESAGQRGPAFVISDGVRAWLLSDPNRAAIDAALPPERSAAWKSLDVAVAHGYLIASLWHVEDTEQEVEFHHDIDSALRAARDGGGVALLLNPTPVADVTAVAAAGDRMPRKSTLFVPKPATGLLIRAFADA
jgi:uncharacterized protein (DUF1015 family)